jgi:diketogulonate reductase-like aldo/keto reductase
MALRDGFRGVDTACQPRHYDEAGVGAGIAAALGGDLQRAGVSNCYHLEQLRELCRAARIKPAVLQNRFYADTAHDEMLRAYCASEGIVYQSFWTANPHILADPAVKSAARRHAREPPLILFRYLIESGVLPLTGTRSRSHMRDDLKLFEFELTQEERRDIDVLLRG